VICISPRSALRAPISALTVLALLYFATAAAVLLLANRYVTPLSRGAALALLLLPLIFTGRAVLTNRVYAPIDFAYLTQPLKDHAGEMKIGEPRNPLLSDIALQMIPWREAVRRSAANGEWPLLNRFELCGDPLAASMQPAVWNPFTWIALLLPAPLSFGFTASIAFLLAALGAFLFARELRCSELASIAAAVIWMFSAANALQILWPLGFAWALLPLVLTATHRTIADARAWMFLAIVLAIEIFAGHPETLLHVVFVASLYGAFELIARRNARPLLPLAAAGMLATLIGAIALLPFLDVERQSVEHQVRQTHAAQPFHTPAEEVRAALIGDAFPFLRDPRSLFQRAEAGSIALALTIFAMVMVRSRTVWFFAALLLFALLAGANAWPVAQLLHRLPLFDVAFNDRLAAVVPLCLAVLAALALGSRWPVAGGRNGGDSSGHWQPATGHLIIMVALTIIIAIAGRDAPDRVRFAAELAPLALAAVAAYFDLRIALLALILIQRTMSDGALVPVFDQRAAYPPLKLLAGLPNEPFRITGRGATMLPNTFTMYGLEEVRGSAAMTFAPLADTFPIWATHKSGQFDEVRDLASPFVAMMNVRYALLDVSDPIPAGWRDVTYDIYTRLIENGRALPRAFVPHRVRLGIANEVEEMARESDFAERAWIDAGRQPEEQINGTGTVVAMRAKNGLTLDAKMDNDAFVVISQTAWNGWRAYVDGRRVALRRANHAFLAVWVPAGGHRVRLVYLPRAFVIGRDITFAALIFLALGLIRRLVID
jgi:membrane protein YfhO